MFNNDLYVRKFPIYESNVMTDLKALGTTQDRLLMEEDTREPFHSWFKRVFLSK